MATEELPITAKDRVPGTTSVFALKIAAWLNLVLCTLGAIYFFREFGVRFVVEEGFLDYTEKVVNPFGITLSFSVFLAGIFGCILFLVIASTAESIIAIRRKLDKIDF